MKKQLIGIILIPVFLFAVDNQKLLDCYEIFDQKKAELQAEAENILEQQEAFESLKNTYMVLMKKKEAKLKQQQKELNATLSKIESEKQAVQNLIKKNQAVLEAIKNAKLDKITQSYSKMRASNAAQILANMKPADALEILQKLPPRVMSKILAKMDPLTAAKLTQMMQNESNESTNTTKR